MRVDFEHVKHVVVTVLKCEDDSVTARCLDERRLERTITIGGRQALESTC
jgi:hypothetical protein